MLAKRIAGFLILAVALIFGAYKISTSGLLDRMGDNWITFLGVSTMIILLIMAIFRVLRA